MSPETSTWTTKKGLAQMLKGGVIMDVVTPDHAKIAEDAGAVAVNTVAGSVVPLDVLNVDVVRTGSLGKFTAKYSCRFSYSDQTCP